MLELCRYDGTNTRASLGMIYSGVTFNNLAEFETTGTFAWWSAVSASIHACPAGIWPSDLPKRYCVI